MSPDQPAVPVVAPVAAPVVTPEVAPVVAPVVLVAAPEVATAASDAAAALPARQAAEEAAVAEQKDLKLEAEPPLVGYEHARALLGTPVEVSEEKTAESE